MEAEHAEFEPLLEACEQGFARLAEHADDDARPRSPSGWRRRARCLARHLRHEETGAIPIIQRVLTQEDWERLDEEHFKEDLTPGKVIRVVPWAAYGVRVRCSTGSSRRQASGSSWCGWPRVAGSRDARRVPSSTSPRSRRSPGPR